MRTALFSHYESAGALGRLNPTVKLAVVTMVAATAIFDPASPGAMLALSIIVAAAAGRMPVGLTLRGLAPYALLGFGYLWMNALFPGVDTGSATVLLRLGPFRLVAEGLARGAVMALRALCFGGASLLFVATTDPTTFALSMVQQLGLSPKAAYSLLAAYRLLPMLESELRQIRAAHRVRGVGAGRGLQGSVIRAYRTTLTLLAGSLRKAGRIAAAMESRGFDGSRDRTWYRDVRVRPADGLYAALMVLALGAILLAARELGSLRAWGGQLW